ncbi:hypothetical protein [Methylohalobius crimeensis]|uniref:hypothetical protein n=1 Tax=Methylohalobius crimeensis TaxID=244365 RepID=UPI0003B6CB28|nr:hypothetical protein [Methylohalobius crimeensis]
MNLKEKIAPLLARLPQSARPRHTLLYITAERTYRADADGHGKLLGEVEEYDKVCEGVDYLPETVEYVLGKRKPARRVWLLFDRLESYSLALPTAQVHGIGAAALTQALCFELEAITGVSVINRQLGYTLCASDDEMRNYWISLIPQRIYDRLQTAIRGLRARLGGVLHSGGLPRPLTEGGEVPWLRLEYWPDCAIGVRLLHPGEAPEVLVVPLEGAGGWQAEVEEWVADHASVSLREQLTAGHTLSLGSEENQTDLRFDRQQDLQLWLSAWARALVEGEELHIPLIQESRGIDREIAYMVASGALALTVVAAHAGWHTYRKLDYQARTDELKGLEKQIKSLRDGLKSRQDRLDGIQQNMAKLEQHFAHFPELMERLRRRPVRLLENLARQRPEELVLTAIERGESRWIVRGVSLRFDAPNFYATALEPLLEADGWQVAPPTKTDLEMFAQGGPWRFDLVLTDSGLEGLRDGDDG